MISQGGVSVLVRFVVLLYNRTSDQVGVNEARKNLFTQKSRNLSEASELIRCMWLQKGV